jgi:hypothetical protein
MDLRAAICEIEPCEGVFIIKGHILNVTDGGGPEFGIKIDPSFYATVSDFQAAAVQAVIDTALHDFGETITAGQVLLPTFTTG